MDAVASRYDTMRKYSDSFSDLDNLFNIDNPLSAINENANREAYNCQMLLAKINEVNSQQGNKYFINSMASFGIVINEPSTLSGGSSAETEKNEDKPDAAVLGSTDDKKTVSSEKTTHIAVIEPVTLKELEHIPKYLKGRITLEDINKIIECMDSYLTQKKILLRAPLKKMSLANRDKVADWKSEISDDGNGMFIDEAQLRSLLPVKSKLHLKPVLPILRHLGRTKEVRNKGNKITIHAL